jgi:hypothetical protein
MGLQSLVIPVNEIDESQLLAMLRIMQTYYLNVDAYQFRADLREKDMVILLYENGAIRGFSTWMLTQHEIQERRVSIIFSGDTIIEKDHWNSMALPIAWGQLMLSVLAKNPYRELYWLLTSKGYKTYRFLPVFFRIFYPSFIGHTPAFEKKLIDSFASHKFGSRFNPLTGILTALDGAQALVPGVADITDRRRKDPHIVFFEKMNPGYARGDELVCLAPCRTDNISPFIMRYLKP